MAFSNLLELFTDKMDYLTQKQAVIAKNVASANIPGYRPKELESFDAVLQKKLSSSSHTQLARGAMTTTNEKHLTGSASSGGGGKQYAAVKEKDLYEVKPGGNAVVLEQQMTDLGRTNQDYAMMTGLYRKMAGLIKTAIGHRG
jgi:flagellar basal-body rod protein FlgB